MRRSACVASIASTLAAFTTSIVAYAMPNFPGEIQAHLELANPPPCNICHGSTSGGGPVSQPFGQAMLAAGLNVTGGSTLTDALDQLDAEMTDSNADGVPDIEALRSGSAPLTAKPPVEYGCAVRGNAGRRQPAGFLAYVMFASLLLLRRSISSGDGLITKADSNTTRRRNHS